MVPDVIEPSSLRFRCYEPVILGGFMVTTKPDGIGFFYDVVGGLRVTTICIVGGFEGYHHTRCSWHYLRCNSGDLASTSSQMCGS